MFLAISQCPTNFWRVSLHPPAIKLRQINSAVYQNLHAAGAARFPGAPRRVDPNVYSLHKVFGKKHVVVSKEDSVWTDFGLPDKLHPPLD